jgi:hypothetical protein
MLELGEFWTLQKSHRLGAVSKLMSPGIKIISSEEADKEATLQHL